MSDIKINKDQKSEIAANVKLYLAEELDIEIGNFDAEFLVDFFAKELGHFFYNQGLYDAAAILSERLDNITDSIYQLEK